MTIAIFGRNFNASARESIATLFDRLQSLEAEVLIYEPFYNFLISEAQMKPNMAGTFQLKDSLPQNTDFLFSIGGDGTFLDTVNIVCEQDIPVVGLNTGRLGFLSYISQEDLNDSLNSIFSGDFDIEERMLIDVSSSGNSKAIHTTALNEVRVSKSTSSLLTVHVSINNEFLSSYWADGILLSTPTGSTAYNLSVGGPIMHPELDTMVLSPIAPHNLTVRPLVLPGSAKINFQIRTRDPHYQLSLDSHSFTLPAKEEISVQRSQHTLKMVRIENNSFYATLRNKLNWGLDRRN